MVAQPGLCCSWAGNLTSPAKLHKHISLGVARVREVHTSGPLLRHDFCGNHLQQHGVAVALLWH